jgi:hypothetical protein
MPGGKSDPSPGIFFCETPHHARKPSMKKSFQYLYLFAVISVAGCTSQSSTIQSDANTPHREPGSWRTLQYFTAFDATGVEGGMAEMTAAGKASVGKKQFGGPVCLSAATAAKDDLTARLGEAIRFGSEWRVIRSQVIDGKVDFLATMDDPQNGKGTMTITGQITPTTTDLIVTTDSQQPAPGKGHIRTVSKQENTRVGDCTPGEDQWD